MSLIINQKMILRNYIIVGVISFNLGCNTILTDSGEYPFIIVVVAGWGGWVGGGMPTTIVANLRVKQS